MKKITVLTVLLVISFQLSAQSGAIGRDSLANAPGFQAKVRAAAINTSYTIVEASVSDALLIKFGQIWISNPVGGQITAMSFGVLRNPAIDSSSSQDQIQQEVGNIYIIQAYAWFQLPPPAQQALRILQNVIDRRSN